MGISIRSCASAVLWNELEGTYYPKDGHLLVGGSGKAIRLDLVMERKCMVLMQRFRR
jgi:hypothetical protein